ncbi:MAG: hypothetical protein GY737_25815 [Desulfobacteraceae bacterium]|nr:hypothetical protein [Desulfobacteraceae bacterium]
MECLFIVQHAHKFDDGTEDVKLIGVYRSRENAEKAISRLSNQPGFRDAQDGFFIDKYELDKDQWTEGYVTT